MGRRLNLEIYIAWWQEFEQTLKESPNVAYSTGHPDVKLLHPKCRSTTSYAASKHKYNYGSIADWFSGLNVVSYHLMSHWRFEYRLTYYDRLLGIAFAQGYTFLSPSSRELKQERRRVVFVVIALLVLDTLHSALCAHAVYYYTITNSTNLAALEKNEWSIVVQVTIASSSVLISQWFVVNASGCSDKFLKLGTFCSYFASRVYYVGQKRILVPVIIVRLNQ
ncbi:hypothetical protein GYMLUDRAFT_62096 [Collybiopsis luxurians FD-317 M1]|uniref:Uncharacterized protein n=1 Tax=Collybiopsis luxurians FD-317 M1 TaxID=944289 RepID=A0A0D0CM35_9AGAR|nr:hypothetical protein GYMLUDRAFT_62096 [Collybiopsis luxurians FD-317 M1]